MKVRLMNQWLAGALFVLCLVLGTSIQTVAQDRSISEIRGSKLFLYEGSTGKVVGNVPKEDLGALFPIPVVGGPENGRYQVDIKGKGAFWIAKKQVKSSNFADTDIKAKCESLSKSYASTRGASEGCSE